MATLVVVGVGAYLGAGATGYAAGVIAVGTAIALAGAVYVDNKYVYPKLFPTTDPQLPAITGIDTMTGEDGSPGHTSWGRYALVGGHVLWFEGLRNDTTATQRANKKGGTPTPVVRKLADVCIGLTRNLISTVEQLNADQKVFWRRDQNNVLWADYRASITTTSGGTQIRVDVSYPEAIDFAQIFASGDVVQLTNALTAINGFYRVVSVLGVGSWLGGVSMPGAGVTQSMALQPLAGQTPSASDAGTPEQPLTIRRMDASIVDAALSWGVASGPRLFVQPNPGPPTVAHDSYYRRPLGEMFPVGTFLLFENFAYHTVIGNPNPLSVNGMWKVVDVSGGTSGADGIYLIPLSGQINFTVLHTAANNVGRVTVTDVEGFLDNDSVVVGGGVPPIQIYAGTETTVPDPDLVPIYGSGNVHGYRGLARMTIRGLNLTKWGDRVPQISGVVKVSDVHTTHHVIRTVMREAFDDDDSRYDLSRLQPDQLLGYTRRGPQLPNTTLQPLATAYDIEAQEQGDVIAFFKGRDADQFQLLETELGAYVGKPDQAPERFTHQRNQDRDMPLRLSVYYRDPLNSLSRTEKTQRSSRPDDDYAEQVALDLDPLVLYPWVAQNIANRLYAQTIVGRDQGSISLPPSRIDLSVGDRVTFTALNWNEELVDVSTGDIDHTTQIAGIQAGTVSLEVDFAAHGRCRLLDDGAGALIGIPTGVTTTTNSVDYTTGRIQLAASDDITDAVVTYKFPHPWRMRIARLRRRVNGISEFDLVAVAEKFAVVGSPAQPSNASVPIAVRPATLQTELLDIASPSIWTQDGAGALYVAGPTAGSTWHGAGVYSSLDGTSYELRGVIANPTPIGVATTALTAGRLYCVDWTQTLAVTLTHGVLNDATLDQIGSGIGTNILLVGNEIIAFLRAAIQPDGSYVLSGLIRGMRDTADEMSTHAAGERVVLLDGTGGDPAEAWNGLFERFATPGDIGRQLWLKIAPAGAILDEIAAQQVVFRGNNVRPFAPCGLVQGDIATYGYAWDPRNPTYDPSAWLSRDITVRWFRRSRSVMTSFGAGSAAPMLEPDERYQVEVLRNGTVIAARTTIVGGGNSASARVHRQFRYTLAEQTADGWVSGDAAEIRVRQIGVGGQFGLGKPSSITWTLP